jgi:hypothetical protein
MGSLSGDAFSGYFWLRSPGYDNLANVGFPGGSTYNNDYVLYSKYADRPALNLVPSPLLLIKGGNRNG